MKALSLTIIVLLFAIFTFGQTQPSVLSRHVQDAKNAKANFQAVKVFDAAGDVKSTAKFKSAVSDGQLLTLKTQFLNALYDGKPEAMEFEIPLQAKKSMTLELVRHELLAPEFSLVTSDSKGKVILYQPGVFYWGIVKGTPNSIAAVSVFENEVIGVVTTPADGNMVLGKTEGDAKNTSYVFYKEKDLLKSQDFKCEALAVPGGPGKLPRYKDDFSKVITKCVRAYLELEYDLVQEKGGATGATNYITGLFNVVAALYQNETITVIISQVFTWTTPDSYPTTSTSAALTSFKNARPTYNGNLAHLVSRGAPLNGGIAYVDALCSSFAYGYSYINSSYSQLPTYSWSVNVLTHETGHNIGSPHTHACAWNGNNTAIDGCGPQIGSNEGCTGPIPTKGTIMSYCHMVSGVGIDFNLGFGPQPGNKIRAEVNAGPCLTSCTGPTGPCMTVNVTGNNISCGGGNTGTATATASGNPGPFIYLWSNGGTTQTISNLAAGTYTVTVTGSAGCTATGSRTVTSTPGLTLTTVVTNATSGSNGAIDLTVSGGTTPYTYAWSNGKTTQDITGLAAGTYTVTVTSANGCTGTKSATVTTSGGGGGTCTPLAAVPHSQNFESGLGSWVQATNDGMNWTVKYGSTPTAYSGPSSAYQGYYYLYTEATGYTNKTAIITSPCFNLATVTNPVFTFAYHMYGAQMGSLKLEISTNAGGSWTTLWTRSANQGNSWKTTSVNLAAYGTATVKFRFVGTTGGDQSDMAIDVISVMGSSGLPGNTGK